MESTLVVGIILGVGFFLGEIARLVGLPKVTGYILAGICLNPSLVKLVPEDFVSHAGLVTNVALAFITFSVGGTLLWSKIKSLGAAIIAITVGEAMGAFLVVTLGSIAVIGLFGFPNETESVSNLIPIALVLGALAAPTDPSATLAVSHQYKARGDVSTTIMGVAAFDDMFGIINFSVAVSVATTILSQKPFSFTDSVGGPLVTIFGGIAAGAVFGLILNPLTRLLQRETEGALIVLIIASLCLCFGIARLIEVDELLATMAAGAVVVNFNRQSDQIFKLLERYTEELIFVLFFTLSGMHLNVTALSGVLVFILIFVVLRAAGKGGGTVLGSHLGKASRPVKRYTAFGLIPQGGIVVGLALMVKNNPDLESIGDVVMSVVIGATVIHELLGPLLAKLALTRAGEIDAKRSE